MDKIVQAVKPDQTGMTAAGGKPAKAPPRFIDKVPLAPVVHTLAYPLEYDRVQYREVAIKHLVGADFARMKVLTVAGLDDNMVMLNLLTNIPLEVLRAMHADDFAELAEKAVPFIPARFLEGGQNSESGASMPASSPTSSTSP